MNWKDRVENSTFKIITGDGKNYSPLWRGFEKSKDFNSKVFDFIDVEGSYVERFRSKGSKFPLVFYFQGKDNILQADEFEKSSLNPNLWKINHPYYGRIIGQPISISRNDQKLNVTQINVDFWESIAEDYPNSAISEIDSIKLQSSVTIDNAINSFTTGATPQIKDIGLFKKIINTVDSIFKEIVNIDDKVDFRNNYSIALKSVDNLLDGSKAALTSLNSLMRIPINSKPTIAIRIKGYRKFLEELKLKSSRKSEKFFYETAGALCISGICETALNVNGNEYHTRVEVLGVTTEIKEIYEDYSILLDSLQLSQYEKEKSWQSDAKLQRSLKKLVIDTQNNLYKISFNSKQERVIHAATNTNLFLIAHKIIGLDVSDKNIENLRLINRIKNKELFRIEKGREIKYYT